MYLSHFIVITAASKIVDVDDTVFTFLAAVAVVTTLSYAVAVLVETVVYKYSNSIRNWLLSRPN